MSYCGAASQSPALRVTDFCSTSFHLLLLLQCITNAARQQGISSSLQMPDKVLNFVKDHFLMDSVIRSQPLLLKRNVRYTQIAIHRVHMAGKAYDVLFIGTGITGRSNLHRALRYVHLCVCDCVTHTVALLR